MHGSKKTSSPSPRKTFGTIQQSQIKSWLGKVIIFLSPSLFFFNKLLGENLNSFLISPSQEVEILKGKRGKGTTGLQEIKLNSIKFYKYTGLLWYCNEFSVCPKHCTPECVMWNCSTLAGSLASVLPADWWKLFEDRGKTPLYERFYLINIYGESTVVVY